MGSLKFEPRDLSREPKARGIETYLPKCYINPASVVMAKIAVYAFLHTLAT